MTDFTIVVPTVGRPSLERLLSRLEGAPVVVVDDRDDRSRRLAVPSSTTVVETRGRQGPAAARNLGWRTADTPWVVFLDDDVLPTPGWLADLGVDLTACPSTAAASKGRVRVPLPSDRRPTDRERRVAGLEGAAWITADMAVRRSALAALGGFDESFRRPYREDSDLALRIMEAGWTIVHGTRLVLHPVTPGPWWVSVPDQRGNREDIMMWRRHGRGWRERAGAGAGRASFHAVTTAMAVLSLLAHRRSPSVSALAAAGWAFNTARFTWERVAPGPRTLAETAAMLATSVAIPPVATFWRAIGLVADRDSTLADAPSRGIDAVLFDRDGTLIYDVPYNGDPEAVVPKDGAGAAVGRLREAGLRIGVVSNQSGIGRGRLTADQVDAVNRRVEELVGRLDAVVYCPHSPDQACDCRKPAPGLIFEAARRLDTDPSRCVVIGDILSDVRAGERAGARSILVPNEATARCDLDAAAHVASSLAEAADMVLAWRAG